MPRRWIVGHIPGFGDFCAESQPEKDATMLRLRYVTQISLVPAKDEKGQDAAVPAFRKYFIEAGGMAGPEFLVPKSQVCLAADADPNLVTEVREMWGVKEIITPPKRPRIVRPGDPHP